MNDFACAPRQEYLAKRSYPMTNGEFSRITQDPHIMAGHACIRGMRVTVSIILSQIGAGQTIESLLIDFPYLEREDILQALRYGAFLASEPRVELKTA